MHRVMYPSFFMLNEIRVKMQVRLLLNVSRFYLKRKYVTLNTSALEIERKGVWHEAQIRAEVKCTEISLFLH